MLQIHHVYENGSPLLWDRGFLWGSAVLLGLGWRLIYLWKGERLPGGAHAGRLTEPRSVIAEP